MLFLVAVRSSDGSMSFLVETTPPEEWGEAIRSAGAHFECVPVETRYLKDRLPHDFLQLAAYEFARGFLRTEVRPGEWDYPYAVPILCRETECLHYQRRDLNLIKSLVQACEGESDLGYELAHLRTLGEEYKRNGFPIGV